MNFWSRALIQIAMGWWFRRQRARTVTHFKLKGIRAYLKALQIARLSAVGVVALLFTLQLMAFGFALMLGAGIYLSPLPEETKLWVAFGTGTALFGVPLVLMIIFLSESVWYQASGAARMVEKSLEDKAA